MKIFVKTLLLPPFGLVLSLLAILLLLKRWPRLGRRLLWVYFALFYLLSMPLFSDWLLHSLQWYPAIEAGAETSRAGAIVILSAGGYLDGPEYREAGAPKAAADRAGPVTLQRVQYGAHLARRTGLPVMTTGGSRFDPERSMARLMKRTLEEDFGVAVRWTEDRAQDTFENARNSAEILRAEGIETVLLVTHAWHMPRSVLSFQAVGVEVIPAPTRFAESVRFTLKDFLPSLRGLQGSYLGLHEWIGLAWYQLWHGNG